MKKFLLVLFLASSVFGQTELRLIPGTTPMYNAEEIDNFNSEFITTNSFLLINNETNYLVNDPKLTIGEGNLIIKINGKPTTFSANSTSNVEVNISSSSIGGVNIIGANSPEDEDVLYEGVKILKFDKDTGFSVSPTNQSEVMIKMNSAWTELIPDLNGQEFSPDYSGEWDIDTDYKIGNIISYNSEYWICKEANKGKQPDESNKWIKLGNLKPQGEEKLSIKVVESDEPGTYWDYSHTNKNEKTFYIGVGPGGERLEHIFNSEIDDAYQIENIKKNYYFDYDGSEISEDPYNIIIPESSIDKNDKLTLYLHQAPSIFAYYNIEPENILGKSYPREKFWLEDEEDGVWTFELKSPPGCTDWNISQYTKRDVGTFVEWIINDEGTIIGYNPSTLKGRIRIPASVNGTNVVTLNDNLFEGQTEVTYFELPEGLETIRNMAFSGCNKITSIVFPNSLVNIYDSAFTGCFALEEITVGNNIEFFDTDVFCDCPNINTIYFTRMDNENHEDAEQRIRHLLKTSFEPDPYYCDITPLECNFEITKNGTITEYEIESETPGCITIPSEIDGIEVVAIDGGVISWNEDITKVILPNTLIQISDGNFNGLSIRTFEIPNSVEEIEGYILTDNGYLKRIRIPASVNEIGDNFGCYSEKLNTIKVSKNNQEFTDENGVLFTKDMTLLKVYPCGKKDETYNIPDGVETIGYDAFCYAYNLTNVYIPDSVTKLDNYAFDSSELKEIYIPDSVVDFGDYESDSYTFEYCSNLEKVRLPQNMTYIPHGIFEGCESLSDIEIPDSVETIYAGAFYGCSSLKEIILPAGLTSIKWSVFSYCHNLTNIVIPQSVEEIGGYAFSRTSITSFEWPESVTEIRDGTFEGCQSLTNIIIPNNVTSIGSYVFSEHTKLTNITIPESVESIGQETFKECSTLTNIVFAGDIDSIGQNLFLRCDNLWDVWFNEKTMEDVQNMDNYPWALQKDCRIHCKDRDIIVPKLTSTFTFSDGHSEEILIEGELDARFQNRSDLINVELGDKITSIGTLAFGGCRGLTTIIIPDSVRSIGSHAFYGCKNLTNVRIPNKVTNIGYWTFRDCYRLTSLTIPASVLNIENEVFAGDPNLTTINYTLKQDQTAEDRKQEIINMLTSSSFNTSQITTWNIITEEVESTNPQQLSTTRKKINTTEQETDINTSSDQPQQNSILSNVSTFTFKDEHTEEIDIEKTMDNRFQSNNELVSVSFGTNISVISERAFSGCQALTNIIFNNNLLAIGGYAFYNCNSLENINLPTNLTTIARFAFAQCNNLTSITIPNTITIIANKAFNGCIKLSTINFILKQNETEEDGQQRIQTLLSNSGFDISQITTWNPISQ